MSKTIVISNQKGGVGKTTTAINLSACLGELGKRVLAVDLDPQGNMSSGLGAERDEETKTVYELLIGEAEVSECIQKNLVRNLDVIPSDINLSGAEIELLDWEDKEFLLKNRLESIKEQYEYIIIDSPPALNMLAINGMTAADSVLIPIQCEYYALEGLTQLIYTIDLVKERLHPDLTIEGILFTMFDARTNLSTQVAENVRENLDLNIYKTVIPRNVKLAEAPSYGMPIHIYAPKSSGAESYMALAGEVTGEGVKKNGRKKKWPWKRS